MYILHYAPDNASMIIRLVLEGAHLPYTPRLVDRRLREQDSAAYRRINPTGLIPTLETPDGPIAETAAILIWLGDTHGLMPKIGDPRRAILLRWLIYLANTPHAELRSMFYPDRYVPAEGIAAHHAMGASRMKMHYAILDRLVADHPWLAGPDSLFTPYLCALLRWSALYPRKAKRWLSLSDFPNLLTMASAYETTPQAQTVTKAEGLGPTPFTTPILPNPPEGSAL